MDGNQPNISARGTRQEVAKLPIRVITYVPTEARAQWVEAELHRAGATVQVARSASAIVQALTEDPTPVPQVLVVDIDAIAPADLFDLHIMRERGWCGHIIALGVVPPPLRASLGVERVLNTPFSSGSLTGAIADIGFDNTTCRIPVFSEPTTENGVAVTGPVLPVFAMPSTARVRARR